jgi:hypothetical protein
MHTLLVPPYPGFMVDHKNGNKLDNRRCNLRLCTRAQNQWNRLAPPRGSSRFTGVSADRRGWRARINYGTCRINVGNFAREVDAAIAYDAKCVELRGDFARPNFNLVVTRSRLCELLSATGGRFFSACFIKRTDGIERVIHCRTGVHPSEVPTVSQISEYHDLLTVWDTQKREFRCIPIEGILWIRLNNCFMRPTRRSDHRALDATTQGLLFARTAG